MRRYAAGRVGRIGMQVVRGSGARGPRRHTTKMDGGEALVPVLLQGAGGRR